MKRNILLFAALTISIFSIAQDSQNERQVKEIGKAFVADWNSHDFTKMPTYTTEDVTWVDGHGSIWQGREKLQSRYQAMHRAVMQNTSITVDTMTVRFITPTVAMLNIRYKVGTYFAFDGVDHGNNKRENSKELRTMTVVKQNDKWLLTAMQVTLILEQQTASTNTTSGSPVVRRQ